VTGRPDVFRRKASEGVTPEKKPQPRAHDTLCDVFKRDARCGNARGEEKTRTHDATASNGGQAFSGLPNNLVVSHILRSEYFDDPADLARLPAVSSAMRDTMAEMGLRFEELDELRAVELGCVTAV
jgi:hypothetical protein